MLELGDDLDRHVLALQHPFDRILPARAGAQIDLIGMQADKTRHFEADILVGRHGRTRGGEQQHQSTERADDGPCLLAQGLEAPAGWPQVGQSGSLAMRMR